MSNVQNITEEGAARRFHHIVTLERELCKKSSEIADCTDHLKDLKKGYDGLLDRLRSAARDEGELPLFNMDSDE